MSAVDQRISIEYLPTKDLIPNEWNPNEVDARTYQAIGESLDAYGFLVPVLVRSHPAKKGKVQIVDGEHRWKIAGEHGMSDVPVIKVDHLADGDIKKLTVILNETRGQADTVPLARLLAELQEDTTLEELMKGLPYERAQLEDLLEIGSIDWGAFQAERSDEVERAVRLRSGKNVFTVFLNFDKAQKEHYDDYAAMIGREKGAGYTVEHAVLNGLALLCKSL